MKLRLAFCGGVLAVAALGPARPAHAEGYLTPNIGLVLGGDTDDSKASYGGTLTFAGEGLVGFAVDFAYTPDFLGTTGLGNNNATTLMGNLVLMTRPARTRIYASGGLGLMKTRVEDVSGFFEVDSNELGINVGGGFVFVPDRLGVQGDVRYYRQLTDPEPDDEFDVDLGDLNFWRVSAGIVFRF
jgi:hypothetical protein